MVWEILRMKNFFVYMYNTIIKLLIGVVPLSNWRKRLRKKLLHKTAFPSGALFFEIKRKKEQLLPLMKHIDTLFLGSSHVAYAFNPQYYSGTSFNLGSNSQDFFTSFSLLEKLVGDLPKLEKVFLGYDIFSRGWNLSKSSASFICASYDFLYNIEYLEKNYTQKDILRCAVLNKKKSVRKDKIGMGGGNGFLMLMNV